MKNSYFFHEEVCVAVKVVTTVRITVVEESYCEYMKTDKMNNLHQYNIQYSVLKLHEHEECITKLHELVEYNTIDVNAKHIQGNRLNK